MLKSLNLKCFDNPCEKNNVILYQLITGKSQTFRITYVEKNMIINLINYRLTTLIYGSAAYLLKGFTGKFRNTWRDGISFVCIKVLVLV